MYIVIELQKTGNQVANIVSTYANKNEADNKYYTVLAAAAVSSVERHAVTMLSDNGACLMSAFYDHTMGE